MDLLECALCNNKYVANKGKHRARNLSCGHYYCHDCLSQIIKSATPQCPSCRAGISVRSADKLPPNFLMDDLINRMKTGSLSMSNEGKEAEFSAGECQKHEKCQLHFTVINLKTEKSRMEKNIKDLQATITDTESKNLEQRKEIDKLQKKMKENEQIVKKANAEIRDCKEKKSKIESIQQELISSVTIQQINQACQKAEDIFKAINVTGISAKSNIKISQFQDLIDQNPVEFVNKILRDGSTVHATTEINGEKRYAQLMAKNGDIHLPGLASCYHPPALNITVTVSSLLKRYTNSDIFLTLASNGKELGTIYIKLRNTKSSEDIRKQCMGIIDPSIKGAVFDFIKDQAHKATVNITDYDPQTMDNIDAVYPWPELSGDSKGLVYTMGSSGLGFVLSVTNDIYFAIGDVIKGMDVLQNAVTYQKGKVRISDVGIVLK